MKWLFFVSWGGLIAHLDWFKSIAGSGHFLVGVFSDYYLRILDMWTSFKFSYLLFVAICLRAIIKMRCSIDICIYRPIFSIPEIGLAWIREFSFSNRTMQGYTQHTCALLGRVLRRSRLEWGCEDQGRERSSLCSWQRRLVVKGVLILLCWTHGLYCSVLWDGWDVGQAKSRRR
jgi:hypothetical protein